MRPTANGDADQPDLTIDRLFDAPALAGPSIASLKIAPDETRVTFLKGKDTDKDRLDLWEVDIESGASRLLVDSDDLRSPTAILSDEEIARRERQRIAAMKGIVEYSFSPSSDALLVPVAGELFYCRLAAPGLRSTVEHLPIAGPLVDPRMAPTGTRLAYVRDDNLFIYDLVGRNEQRLTADGGGVIKNGLAEFVAQEEMDRSTGFWWAPDATRIAYARVDESRVIETQRFEVSADNVKTFAQRYPYAGATNARVQIGIVDIGRGATVWVDLGPSEDIYVARVDWLPDGRTLAIQRQSRDQRRLDLLFAEADSGRSRVILTESSESWIDLHHELTFLKERPEFIWASSRTGFLHLYLYGTDGVPIRSLTQGDWNIDNFRARALRGVDEAKREIFFLCTAGSPLQRQLFRASLDGGELTQVTTEPGIHAVSMSPSAGWYVDHFSSSALPPRVGLYGRDGRLRFWLLENRLDASHPGAPYLTTNARGEFGEVAADDGQPLYYRLFKPHDLEPGKRYPAIVDVYGGPGVQRVLDNWSGAGFSEILTRSGYVVLMLDNRGSAHRGTAFQSPIRGRLSEVEVADQLAGVRWLTDQPFIDPARIGVWGWSYGGYMALMLMFRLPGVFKAGVSGAPVTDWQLYDSHYTERFMGQPGENRAGYEASSVIPYAAGLAGSLLLMHGMADDNVLLLHTTKLVRKLQDLGKPFEIMVYPGAKHGLLRQNDGRHAYATMLRFFDERLAPETHGSRAGTG